MDNTIKKSRGRPPKFSFDEGLTHAKVLFWRDGYEAFRINSLCQILNVPPTSIYARYQSKLELYRLALNSYVEDYLSTLNQHCEHETTLADLVRQLLECSVTFYFSGPSRAGCMLLESGINSNEPRVGILVGEKTSELKRHLTNLLNVVAHENQEELVILLLTMLRGLSAQVKFGLSEDDLMATIEFFCVSFE